MPAPAAILYRRDLLGRLVAAGTAADPQAFGAWSYRGDGTLAQETLKAGGTVAVARSFAYDELGRPVSIDEPALTLAVSYRKDGDPAKPYAHGGITAETVTCKPAGFATGAAVPQGSTTTYAYDPFGRLVTARSSERPALDVDAAYDGNGNLENLAQAGTSRSYVYDGASNRLDKVMLSGTEQTYGDDAAGRVTNAAGTSLVRDPATGRMRRGTKDGRTVAVLRDARGRIVLTTQGATKRLTVRDGQGAILLEREGASLAAVHLHAATGRIGLWTGNAPYAVSRDLRGSTRILYGADGKAAAWLSYCAYGATDIGASSSNALTGSIRNRYTGQDWLAPLALYDYGARLYDPALGRFLSPDPADETPSPYVYVGGDPVDAVDPDGAYIVMIIYFNSRIYAFSREAKIVFVSPVIKGPVKEWNYFADLNKAYEAKFGPSGAEKPFDYIETARKIDWITGKSVKELYFPARRISDDMNALIKDVNATIQHEGMDQDYAEFASYPRLDYKLPGVVQFHDTGGRALLITARRGSPAVAPANPPQVASGRNVGYMANPPPGTSLQPVSPPRAPRRSIEIHASIRAERNRRTGATEISGDDSKPTKRALSEKRGNPYANVRQGNPYANVRQGNPYANDWFRKSSSSSSSTD